MVNDVSNAKRMIDTSFLEELKEGGVLYPVTCLVKEKQNKLMLAFRGKYINVYYRGHSIYKISQKKSEFLVEFNFNYARFTEKFEDAKNVLCKVLRMKLNTRNNIVINQKKIVNRMTKEIKKVDEKFWNESMPVLKNLMDDFFDDSKKKDFFKPKDKEVTTKHTYLEKQRQQEIVLANQNIMDGYFIYDMEYSMPSNNKDDKKMGRYDMLAVKSTEGEIQEIALIQLNSIKEASDGVSGIAKQEEDFTYYTDEQQNKEVLEEMKTDALDIVSAYIELFGLARESFTKDTVIPAFKPMFIFTDEAKSDVKKVKTYSAIPLDDPWKL